VDPRRLADLFSRLQAAGQPAVVKRDGSNIDLGVLRLDEPASADLIKQLPKLRVGTVAGASADNLKDALAAQGIDVKSEKAAIEDAWATADSLLKWLAEAPSDWQFTPEALG
jgi:hypothetical protein